MVASMDGHLHSCCYVVLKLVAHLDLIPFWAPPAFLIYFLEVDIVSGYVFGVSTSSYILISGSLCLGDSLEINASIALCRVVKLSVSILLVC